MKTNQAAPLHFAEFNRYICTANEDGSIPLNAKCAVFIGNIDSPYLLERLLAQANAYPQLVAALRGMQDIVAEGEYSSDEAVASRALLSKLGAT